MREIKFRAWNKRVNRFLHPSQFIILADGTFHWLDYLCGDKRLPESQDIEVALKQKYDIDNPAVIDCADWSHGDMIVEQFTGLKDQSGREIYEGDIVASDMVPYEPPLVVYWDEKEGRFDTWSESVRYLAPTHGVIGNIHENPDSLKG